MPWRGGGLGHGETAGDNRKREGDVPWCDGGGNRWSLSERRRRFEEMMGDEHAAGSTFHVVRFNPPWEAVLGRERGGTGWPAMCVPVASPTDVGAICTFPHADL